MENNVTQLPRFRKAEDICENCIHCHIGKLENNFDLRSQKVYECRFESPSNIFTKEGMIIQPKMTIPNYWCSRFEK